MLAGIDMAGTEGQRQLLVLSDGADTSDTDLEDVTAAIGDADVLVNVVALEQEKPAAVAALSDLAEAGGGQVIAAESEALNQAFNAEADVLARQVLVTAEVPSSVTRTEATVVVTLGSNQGDLVAEAFSKIGDATAEGPSVADVDEPLMLDSTFFYAGLAALGVGLLIVMLMAMPRKQKPLTGADLASTYASRVGGVKSGEDDPAAEAALAQATATAERVLGASKNLETRIADRLDAAGNPFKPAEWLLLHVGVFVVMGLIGLLLGGGSLVLGLIFLVLGAFGPWMYLGFKRKRRKKKFESLLPDTLQLISGSLSAGLSLAQSIDTVVREGQEPIAGEFKRVLIETRLGDRAGRRARGRGGPVREPGLRLGRDGDPDPASGRWQPGRAPRNRRRNDARARVHAPAGLRARRGGQAVRVGAGRPARGVHALLAGGQA